MLKLEVKNKLARQKRLLWLKLKVQKGPWWRKLVAQMELWWRKLVAQKAHQLRGRGLVRMEIRVVKLMESLKEDLNSSLLMRLRSQPLWRRPLKLREKNL